MTLNHYAQDNRHHGLSSVPASCLYLQSVGGDGSTLTLPGVQYGGGMAPSPPVFPLVKLFSKLFIHCSTKYLLSSFSVPSSKTKKRKPILVPRALPVQNRQLNKRPCLFPRCLGQEACSPKIALWLFFSHLWDLSLFILYCRLPRWLSGKESTCNAETTGHSGSVPVSGRSPGGGHDNTLQCSCLEIPMDRGAWQATVHGVAKSQTGLKWLSTHTLLPLFWLPVSDVIKIEVMDSELGRLGFETQVCF